MHLYADPTRIEQILVNFLTNAAKYTPPGGRIQITAGAEGDAVIIRVRDNGIGIAPDDAPPRSSCSSPRRTARSPGRRGDWESG